MRKIIFTFLFTVSIVLADSSRTIRIGTFNIPKYVQSTTEGDFVELIRLLAKKSQVNIEIVLIPPKRLYKELSEGNIDGLFPALNSRGLDNYERITDFYTKEMFTFERRGHDYRKIKNAKVCVTDGYSYPVEYVKAKGWVIVPADSDKTCLKLLEKKRVDLFVGENITVNSLITKLKMGKVITFDKYMPISSDKVTLIFNKDVEGKKLSKKFDKALKEIIMDRRYKNILSTGDIRVE